MVPLEVPCADASIRQAIWLSVEGPQNLGAEILYITDTSISDARHWGRNRCHRLGG
jgi:hypothetical protein